MKNKSLLLSIVFAIIVSNKFEAQTSRFKTTQYGHCLMGHQIDWWGLSFGQQTSNTQYGKWNIQLYGQNYPQSLNFWKPGGSANAGDFKFAISELGHVAIGGEPNPWVQKTAGGWPFQYQVQNFKLQVHGNAIADAWFTWSDSTMKENMTIVGNALPNILKLQPLEYNYKQDYAMTAPPATTTEGIEDKVPNEYPKLDSGKQYGFTAQAVSRIYPNLVRGIGDIQTINYTGLVPILVKGIQEQQAIIESMKQKIADLEGKTVYTDVDKTKLFQNNPNPFKGTTTLTYFIDESTTVTNATIEVRELTGLLKSTILLSDKSGLGKVDFNSDGLNDGYYIYTLKVNGSVKDSKMLLVGE